MGQPGCGHAQSPERGRTQGSETSQYLEEKKENSIPGVEAIEMGTAQTSLRAAGGCRTLIRYTD